MSKNTLENRFFINKRLKIKQTTGKIEAISRFTRRVSLLSGLGEHLFSKKTSVQASTVQKLRLCPFNRRAHFAPVFLASRTLDPRWRNKTES